MIKYILVDNPLTPDPNDFRAQVIPQGTMDVKDILKACMSRGTMVTETDLRAVMHLIFDVISSFAADGYNVNTPIVNVRTLLRGVFTDEEEPFNRDKHEIKAGISSGVLLRDKFKAAPVEKTKASLVGPRITSFFDQKTGLKNSEFTPGGMGMLKGSNLRYDSLATEEGIYFRDTAGAETKVSDILETKPGKISFSIPDTLATGFYTLILRTRMGTTTMREAKREYLEVK